MHWNSTNQPVPHLVYQAFSLKIERNRLPGSVQHARRFRSCHPIITSKDLNKLKTQQLFINSSESWSHRGIAVPNIGEMGRCREHTNQSRNLFESQVKGRRTWIVIDELLEAQCGKLWELKPKGDPVIGYREVPTFLWVLSLGALSCLTVNLGEKFSCASGREMGKGTTW